MNVRYPLVNAREGVQGKMSAPLSMKTLSLSYTCVRWLFIYWLFGTAIHILGMNWWALKINCGAVMDVILIAFHRDVDALIPTKLFFVVLYTCVIRLIRLLGTVIVLWR